MNEDNTISRKQRVDQARHEFLEKHHLKDSDEQEKQGEQEIQILSPEDVRTITQTKHFDDFVS